jgi:hypothetical protein
MTKRSAVMKKPDMIVGAFATACALGFEASVGS